MNHLTVNLHLLLASFYRPDKKKYRIICEANAFSSDQYVLESHVKHHGMDPADTIIEVHPREGEYHIRTEDIGSVIEQHASSLALVLWGGVHYYSGEVADMQTITRLAHRAGAIAGFDLAHAIGNIALQLHEWNVDFACWCSYKYLNAGPGAIGGAFIHERYHNDKHTHRLAGWWGYEEASRFRMKKGFLPTASAQGWQLSTPPIILMAALLASLEIFDEAGMDRLIAKGKKLSDYLVYLINDINKVLGRELINIITPAAKGCQVSMIVNSNAQEIFEQLAVKGIFADWREPAVIRVAPVPLYNTFTEVQRFSEVMKKLIA